MTDTPVTTADPTVAAAPVAEAAPGIPAPAPAAPRSRTWIGILAAFVAIALLAGATAALFVRVQDARDRADRAVVLAGGQDALQTRLDQLDASLASLRSGSATAADLTAARDQVTALRKCVNNALDAWAQGTQAGKPVSITKC